MYPNSALSAWQLIVMAVVAIASLGAWIVAVFLADRGHSPVTSGTLTEFGAVEGARGAQGVGAGEGDVFEEHVRARPTGDQRAA